MAVSHQKVLFFDRGRHTYLAPVLAEHFGEVWYSVPMLGESPHSKEDQVGCGLEGVEKIDDFWGYIDRADLLYFPDCYDGEFVDWLRKKGYLISGSGLASDLECNRILFLDTLKDAGLPVPKTYRAEGMDDLENYLSEKENLWIKAPYIRGDFDTKKFITMKHCQPWLNDLRHRLGKRGAETAEFLVQDHIDAICEPGYDGFCIDGNCARGCAVGYEIKDKGYVLKVFQETPSVLSLINEKMAPIIKKMGYRGHFSTEVRIAKNGKAYFIDPTLRVGSPPGELTCELYNDYGQIVWDIAEGTMPRLKAKSVYGAELVLTSDWNQKHEMCVEFPDKLAPYIKLKNYYKKGKGTYYVLPNDAQDGYFGDVVGWGDTVGQAINKVMSVVDEIVCDDMDYDFNAFDKAREQIEAGRKCGISF